MGFLRLFCVFLLCLCGTAFAQDTEDSDRGFIAGLLEENLGGEGRIVRIEGFAGALSSTATIDQITIADEDGVWLSLSEVAMEWNRRALLSKRIEIETLSAAEVSLVRPPIAPESELPAAEASGFALPDLPVSVQINTLRIDRIILGEAILGDRSEMKLEASAQLAGGSGTVKLDAQRIDGQVGQFIVDAAYDAATEGVVLNLDLREDPDGIVARSLDLIDRPDLRLTVAGTGTLDDLVTEIALETDGAPRLSGQVELIGTPDVGREFRVDLGGDLSPLIPPEYRRFFGTETALKAQGQRSEAGALDLSEFDLKTEALAVQGALALSPDFWPQRIALDGEIATSDGAPILLPGSDGSANLKAATLKISYDEAVSDALTARVSVEALNAGGVAVQTTTLTANGTLADTLASQAGFMANVAFTSSGIAFADPALQEAVGTRLAGDVDLNYTDTGALRLDDLRLDGTQYGLNGNIAVAGLSDEFETTLDAVLRADDLSRFAALVGLDLKGQAQLSLEGTADLGGAFDMNVAGTMLNTSIGIAQADALLSGTTRLDLNAVRDGQGTRLPRLTLSNPQVRVTASADLKTDASTAQFDVKLADSNAIDANLKGPIALRGDATQDALGWSVDLTSAGPFDAQAAVTGRVTGATPSVAFDLTLPDSAQVNPALKGAVKMTGTAMQDFAGWNVDVTSVGPFAAKAAVKGRVTGEDPSILFDLNIPDINALVPQYRGASQLSGRLNQVDGDWHVNTVLSGPYGLDGTLNGTVAGSAPNVKYAVRIPNIAPLGAGISGALALDGTAAQQSDGWRVATNLQGLSGTQAQLSGLVRPNGTLNMSTQGSAPLALANAFIAPRNLQGQARFDLAINGPPNLSSVSGSVTTTGARLSAPTLKIALNDIGLRANLNQGRVTLDTSAAVSSGGRITVRGPISDLGRSNSADLEIALQGLKLVDPELYETTIVGALNLRGSLSGGATIAGGLRLGDTNIQIPSSQSAGFAIVPQISHVNPTAPVRRTIARAGLNKTAEAGGSTASGPAYNLNIRIDAPSRIFVRGRGLDAELGGSLLIAGRTDQVISSGRFNLIRGRLNVLSKRFELDEGSVVLQGRLDPYLRFVATTTTAVGTASIILEGLASQPTVSFSSSPEAPEEEVLAQIFFGRDVTQLSAFQALQLASAVATLADKGGEGVVSKLRRNFGLDDVDITTDAQGNTGVRLGKYISDNVYTNVTIGDSNTAGVSLNIDLTPNLTVRGEVGSDGDTSIGLVFERDY